MSSEVQIVLTAVDKASATLNQAGQQTSKLSSNLIAAAKAAGVATLAYKGLEVLKTTVTDTVAYAEQVRDLSRALGINAEESSKLLQIADDLKIEQQQLTVAFRYAINKGVDPSINGLKKLATEYQSIQDPIEKAQFAMENFGTRGGLEMQKVLELTGDELDAMAQSAVDAGLVLSDESAQAARDFEIALDGLDDTVKGLSITIGNDLIPALTDAANGLNDYFSEANKVKSSAEALDAAEKAGIITLEEKIKILGDLANRTADFNRIEEIITDTELALRDDRRESIETLNGVTDATMELTEATEVDNSVLDAAMEAVKKSNIGLAAKIELEKELKLLTGEVTKEELAMKEAVGFLTKMLETGKITQEEYIALMVMLQEDAALASEMIKGVGNAVLLLPDSKDIHINVRYHQYGEEPGPDVPVVIPPEDYVPGPDQGPGGQFGLHMIVPPGYPNDTYNVRASSGERVDITPQNQINNYNLTINEAGSRGNVVMDFALLRALARG